MSAAGEDGVSSAAEGMDAVRKCPVCSVDLEPVDYEGFRVLRCGTCGGHLVSLDRFDSIRRVDRKSMDELKAEASAEFRSSTSEGVGCPRCRGLMRKEKADIPVLDLQTDVCRRCSLVWLDGGELALLQLGYQSKKKFINAQEYRRRMQELEASPERKARFEENLARLPDAEDPVSEALGEAADSLLGALIHSAGYRPRVR